MILTYPITSNEAETRVNNLMLMAAHRTRLNDISNDDVMKKFSEKPRLVKFRDKAVVVSDD